MKFLKHWKKAAAAGMAALALSCSFAVPVMAHCHGGGHCGSQKDVYCTYQGTYCAYHDTCHNKKTDCNHYCPKHKTTHENGKMHHAGHHH